MNLYQLRENLKTKSIFDIGLVVSYYARVSTDKEEQKNSIENQERHFEDLIKANKNWKFYKGYVDDGISGIHAEKREEFQHMLRDARNHKFDLLITKEISRFARNTLDSIQYTRELLSYGVCVWFQNDNINTADEDSELRLTIMACIAQDEIRKLSSRVKFGHAQSIKRGVVLGNSHIYGYDKENGILRINEKEASMVRDIFEKYATGEWSTQRLEEYLFRCGYRNYKGGKILSRTIQHIITNPKYKGYYAGGKVKIIDMFTKKQQFLEESDWVMFKDDGSRVPAIVDEATWEKANQYYRERSKAIKTRRTSYKTENLFTGKIKCAEDGATYWMKQHSVRGKEDVRWVCSYRIKNGADKCPSFGLAESELKKMLIDILQASVIDMDRIIDQYLLLYQKTISKETDHSKDIERIEKQILTIKKKKDKILDFNLNGDITDEEFSIRNKEFNQELQLLEAQRKKFQTKTDISDVKAHLNFIAEQIKQYTTLEEKDITKSVVSELIERIDVKPVGERKAHITFVLKNGQISEKTYENQVCCSGNTLKKMIEAQERQMAGK
ncbi:MAG: recombinase family protein [Lachnospiraceae bacterium]